MNGFTFIAPPSSSSVRSRTAGAGRTPETGSSILCLPGTRTEPRPLPEVAPQPRGVRSQHSQVDERARDGHEREGEPPEHGHDEAAVSERFAAVEAIEEGLVDVARDLQELARPGVDDESSIFTSSRLSQEDVYGGLRPFELEDDLVDGRATGFPSGGGEGRRDRTRPARLRRVESDRAHHVAGRFPKRLFLAEELGEGDENSRRRGEQQKDRDGDANPAVPAA